MLIQLLRYKKEKYLSMDLRNFEIFPPVVDTALGGGGVEEKDHGYRGIKPDIVAAEFLTALARDEYEIAVGDAKNLV